MTTIFPTPMFMLLGTVLVAGISGYMIGAASSSSRRLVPNPPFASSSIAHSRISSYDKENETDDENLDDEPLDHAPNWGHDVKANTKGELRVPMKNKFEPMPVWDTQQQEECKMVLVVRTDLGMSKGWAFYVFDKFLFPHRNAESFFLGKIGAQCSHAAIACYKRLLFSNPTSHTLRKWEKEGQAKVTLQVKSQDELVKLHAMAQSLDVVAEIITDAGRTQIPSGSQTVLGIGPAPKNIIDKITGSLKLL
ncbi:Peptidyl-tRNA hydrolase 2, mitochondrial [Erysiphe neolycopersici]|uniref:peptidyl-tRNA hydrolase n=1 Tax=Erysiphe neolycopersici TaxID=212602 RepID=A0A420I766_9PEZI|nr:Peptidyl-tRNA hydrolase 2, mitochondrial [Erysiphe neolycopersici]